MDIADIVNDVLVEWAKVEKILLMLPLRSTAK